MKFNKYKYFKEFILLFSIIFAILPHLAFASSMGAGLYFVFLVLVSGVIVIGIIIWLLFLKRLKIKPLAILLTVLISLFIYLLIGLALTSTVLGFDIAQTIADPDKFGLSFLFAVLIWPMLILYM